MKIAVFGYYHHLNYGDDRLGQALVHALYPHTVILLPHNQSPPDLNWFDFVLIGGGGLVWERVGIWVDIVTWLTKNKKPFGVVGLGINELKANLKSDLLWLVEHAEIFAVRDRKSHALLDFHPKIKVMPDLTWMIPYPLRNPTQIDTSIAISVATKHPEGYNPLDWQKSLRAIANGVPFPLRFGKNHDADIFRALGFDPVPQEFSIESLYRCQALIATRFHAAIFAIQIGVPFVAILYDDKVRRLLSDHNLEDLGIEPDEFDRLEDKVNRLIQDRAIVTTRILQVNERLRLEGEQLRAKLFETVDAHCPRLRRTAKQRVSRLLKQIVNTTVTR
jgi:polysaccharide pyruvyl transferase WcaK-like protein